MYLFTNIIGSFVLDEQGKIKDKILFKTIGEYQQKEIAEKKLAKKYGFKVLPLEKLIMVLPLFKENIAELSQKNKQLTKLAIKQSVGEDQLIIQAISNLEEIERVTNLLAKRLREWYSWYAPEVSWQTANITEFLTLVSKPKKELLKKIAVTESMGADLAEEHLEEIRLLAQEISRLFTLKEKHESYLEKILRQYCPNLAELGGIIITAKLIQLSKSLKNLALLPASTVQLLGAEKALFRHLKTGAKSPKYGVILAHPLVQKAQQRGKAARYLADKLSLCARLDYFKGEFKAKQYWKELEKKLE